VLPVELNGTEQDSFESIFESSDIRELLLPAWNSPGSFSFSREILSGAEDGSLRLDRNCSIPDEASTSNETINALNQNGSSVSIPDSVTPVNAVTAADMPRLSVTLPSEPNNTTGSPSNDIMTIAENFSLEKIIAAGLETLVRESTTTTSQPSLPPPWTQCIHFTQTHIILACLHNAESMGFKVQDVMTAPAATETTKKLLFSPSPFHHPSTITTTFSNPAHLLASVTNPSTPTHLKPTLPQILYPHPAFIDLIPIPVFRARAVTLLATQPQLIDTRELKNDLAFGNGICYWSSSSSGGGKSGQPWDMRSWEVAPWFWRKWRMLFAGEDGEVWRQSAWWRRARGEG
jgi:Domain of unknown function (DUF3425)